MATAGGGRATNKSGGAGVKLRKRPFQPEINEEPQRVSQEAGQNNSSEVSELSTHQGGSSASISVAAGNSELEQSLKQMTFTRSEAQRLIASTTNGSIKRHKHGDESDNFHVAAFGSRVLEEEIVELANAYKSSNIGTGHGQATRQDSNFINSNATQHPTTIENLPEELLLNIFIRLLAKQLAQIRSVCKSWKALLSESSFVKSHLNHSIRNNDQVLLVFYRIFSGFNIERFITHSCRSPHLKLTNFVQLPVDPLPDRFGIPERYFGISVIGSVNGLICSSYRNSSVIHIWNPSLSAVLTLPPYSTPSHGYNMIQNRFRFGFDPKTDDYKVVKLTDLTAPPLHVDKRWLDVAVYSMRKGSWELITERFPSHITDIYENEVVCVDGHDGRLHWLGIISGHIKTILAFDLGLETFHEIPLPDSTLGFIFNLGHLGGKLCLMTQFDDFGFEVWVMDEYGVAESWVKRHVFSEEIGDYRPHVYPLHNVILTHKDGYLVSYDPIANKETVFKKIGAAKEGPNKIVEYVDSLVWIAPAKREMVDDAAPN